MYTIKEASQRTGVSVALLRAWERRYGIVAPTRTEAGYRLYDGEAIANLRAMRALVDRGWSPRQAAERVKAAAPVELDALATEPSTEDRSSSDPIVAFVQAAARIDSAAIERALDEIFASVSFERMIEDRLYPALVALGDGWVRGDVDVAGEHAASAATIRRLGMAFEAAGNSGLEERPVLVGLPPEARHEVTALVFATAARRAGLPVVYLGADVPPDSWVEAVRVTGAQAVVLGVAIDEDVAAADRVVTALRQAAPELTIAVGGRQSASVQDADVMRLPDQLSAAIIKLRVALN